MSFNDKALEVMRRQHEVLGKIIWREEEWRRQDRMVREGTSQRSSSTLADMTVPLNPLIPTELQTPAPSLKPCEPAKDSSTSPLGKHALESLLLQMEVERSRMNGLLATFDMILKKLIENSDILSN